MKALTFLLFSLLVSSSVLSQPEQKQKVRLAKLVIDSTQLERYNAFLREEIETSVKVEPGVLTLYAVAERDDFCEQLQNGETIAADDRQTYKLRESSISRRNYSFKSTTPQIRTK